MLRLASETDATFEPYSNICPISGRTEVNVERTGKNLLPMTVDGIKALNTSGTWSGNAYTFQGITYTVNTDSSGNVTTIVANGTSTGNADLVLDRNNQLHYPAGILNGAPSSSCDLRIEQVDSPWRTIARDTGSGASFNEFTEKAAIFARVANGVTVSNVVLKPMIRKASIQDDTFEPYHAPDTASVTFGQTVYGGTVDFVTGKCRVNLGYQTVPNTGWSRTGSGVFYKTVSDMALLPNGVYGRSNKYKSMYPNYFSTGSFEIVFGASNFSSIARVLVKDRRFSTAEEFMADLSTNPLQIVYELAEPIELTLTPAQLSLLEDTNILTADGTINLTYLGSMASNVQDEIDEFESGLNNVIGSIAFIENSTAKTSHAVGEYVILNGIFCKVISAVSSGEILSFGTNIQATTIGAELRSIWSQLNA